MKVFQPTEGCFLVLFRATLQKQESRESSASGLESFEWPVSFRRETPYLEWCFGVGDLSFFFYHDWSWIVMIYHELSWIIVNYREISQQNAELFGFREPFVHLPSNTSLPCGIAARRFSVPPPVSHSGRCPRSHRLVRGLPNQLGLQFIHTISDLFGAFQKIHKSPQFDG